MIDIYKYQKKNYFFKYLISNILNINVDNLKKPFFFKTNYEINFDVNFFYRYKKEFPQTKWMKIENSHKFYQSNHDLQNYNEMKIAKKKFEEILNKEIKIQIFKRKNIGKFKIKNMWFTIQSKNVGHESHNHPKSILSGVYYINVEKDFGGELNLTLNNNQKTFVPTKYDLIVFNSSVFHSVSPYLGNRDRIAVAWDAVYTF